MSRYKIGDTVLLLGHNGKPTAPVWYVTWVYVGRDQVDLRSVTGGSRVAVDMDRLEER